MSNRPTILISNDDGIDSTGINALVEVAKEFGNVVVVAPDSPQSAQSHSITIEHPVRIFPSAIFGQNVVAYSCSGTPVDCIKIAKHVVLKGQKIDLCLSGVNHGSNASTNVIYSGTMAAAMEMSMEGVPSIGFSLLNYASDADFTATKHFAKQIIAQVLENGLGTTNLLNVNIPKLPLEGIKGTKVCRQAKGYWMEEFIEARDPANRPYYWLTGKYIYQDQGEDTDIWALENDYVSIVPVMHDLTDYQALPNLEHLDGL